MLNSLPGREAQQSSPPDFSAICTVTKFPKGFVRTELMPCVSLHMLVATCKLLHINLCFTIPEPFALFTQRRYTAMETVKLKAPVTTCCQSLWSRTSG